MRREPIIPIDTEECETKFLRIPGRPGITRDYRFILKPQDTECIRQGYGCVMCLEVQETTFPDECSLCGFPMAKMQTQLFGDLYEGEETFGGDLEDKLAALEEADARKIFVAKPSIIVPRGI